jgi:RimJ/RimL family protein N-acetyltransferase/aminoglycoside phosphotransferase
MRPDFVDYRVRKEAERYREPLAKIGERHRLDVRDATVDEHGVNLVFHLVKGPVVKLFTGAPASMEHEALVMTHIQQQPQKLGPTVLHHGVIGDLSYLVMTRIPGGALVHAWDLVPPAPAAAIREQLGGLLRQLHRCTLPSGTAGSWLTYLQDRRERTVHRQREKGCPEAWLRTMPGFLDDVAVHGQPPSRLGLLHGEMNADHVFVEQEDQQWRVTGLIDFQAAMMGDPEHELAQAGFHCCFGQPAWLRALLRGYGLTDAQLTRDLQRRFMAHFLLFAWCPFQRYIVKPDFAGDVPPGDFGALAGRWFDFGLVYKVSPPRESRTFEPSVFYRTEDFKSSSTRPKPGYIRDTLLYAGDEREISIHMQTNRRSDVAFRPLTAAEEAAGYQIICDTVEWLRTKGIDLWRKPLPREIYAARQERGENFGLFVGGELAVIVSLVNGVPEYWAAEVKAVQPVWLCTLATATEFRRRDLGRQAVSEALRLLRGRVMYLDCKPGWLEEFYRSLGFVELEKKTFTLSHGPCGPIDAVLMRWMACPVSARLRFRPVTAQDADNLLLIFGDPVAMEFWPATKTREEIVKSIEWIRQGYREHGHGLWAVELKETGEFVGRAGLIHQEEGVEVGYALAPRHWHRGYATEAALACRDWAFEHLECDRVISLVHTRNLPSCRVAERNGMRVVTEITHANLPHHVYAITREEWENRPGPQSGRSVL